jgi:hypothetical protein
MAARPHNPLARLAAAVGLVVVVLIGVGPAERPGTQTPGPVAPLEQATVTLHGRDGSFGVLGAGVPAEALPSGQSLARWPVHGWTFPAGAQAGATTVASDGTVLVAGAGFDETQETAEPMPVAAYRPGTGAATVIEQVAPSIEDLAPVGDAVVFTAAGPVLGVLTTVEGHWRVAQTWAGADLGGVSRLGTVVALPGSGHLIAAVLPDPESDQPGGLLALALTGPDPDGRFGLTVTGEYQLPDRVYDPVNGNPLQLFAFGLHADPTRAAGEERFAVVLRDRGADERPLVLQEFRYDARAGTLEPVTAPTISGSQTANGDYLGFASALYDRDGNLWVARHHALYLGETVLNLGGGRLAVYARSEDGGSPIDCGFDPDDSPSDYRTGSGADAEWGQDCPPDYDIVQTQELPVVLGLAQSPDGDVVALSLLGGLIAIRPTGSGDDMTFQVGNPIGLAFELLPATRGGLVLARSGGFDPDGQLWLAASHSPPDPRRPPDQPAPPAATLDQWLYEVDTSSVFQPAPVLLPVVPGQTARIPSSYTSTTATFPQYEFPPTVDIVSQAHFGSCLADRAGLGCSHDGVPGGGWELKHHKGWGHLGGEVSYRVQVPRAGRYRVAYRVGTFPQTERARITLTVGDQEYSTPVSTGGVWRTIPQAEPIDLAAGVHTITLAPPEGGGGWYFTWFTLRREEPRSPRVG